MSNSVNVDIAVECVKNIVDSNRCVICDKSGGSRLRYICGHTSCDDCVDRAGDCLLCFTQPVTSAPNRPLPDEPLTQRANNAAELLVACQQAFNVDVYRRQRLSEQLKTEKELFPKCIQAPLKYFNKRKSSIGSLKNKENRQYSIFPGEQISPYKGSKMEKSAYIKQWIQQNENALTKSPPRKPFADLNLNHQKVSTRHSTPIKKRVDVMFDKVHENSENSRNLTTRKRSHYKRTISIVKNSQSKLNKYLKQDIGDEGSKTLKKNVDKHEKSTMKRFKEHDKDESGIVADLEPIVIECSESETIDKDKQAWLAVLEAENNLTNKPSSPIRLECNDIIKYTDNVEQTCEPTEFSNNEQSTVCNKVPFYKKSYILEKCKHCVDYNNKSKTILNETHSKDVSITIESSSFITTIKVSNNVQSNPKIINKHSTPVQTDINAIVTLNNKDSQKTPNTEPKHSSNLVYEQPEQSANTEGYLQSQDLFTGEAKTLQKHKSNEFGKTEVQNMTQNEASNVIVDDSDSDGEIYESIVQVKADVHRSSDQLEHTPCKHHTEDHHNVLAELDENVLQLRTRHSNRGTTPGSTDSSEKENYDPNRQKRLKFNKKDLKKKRNRKKQDIFELHSIYSLKE